MASARCVVAEAEIALASRDLQFSEKALVSAKEILDKHGDRVNAIHAECVRVRRLLLLGKSSEAQKALLHLQLADAPCHAHRAPRCGQHPAVYTGAN